MSRGRGFVLVGLAVALLLAGVVSNFASSAPDGLDSASLRGCTVDADGRITGGTCIAQGTREHELAGSPFAEYAARGVNHPFLATAVSGVTGVLLTFALAGLLFGVTRRRGRAAAPAGRD